MLVQSRLVTSLESGYLLNIYKKQVKDTFWRGDVTDKKGKHNRSLASLTLQLKKTPKCIPEKSEWLKKTPKCECGQ